MTGADDNDGQADADRGHEAAPVRPQFRVVPHPDGVGADARSSGAVPVQLLREYKGLTVADLLRDEIVDHLPGQVRSALVHIQRGDLAAAEHVLPGEFAPILQGPKGGATTRVPLLLWLLLTAVFAAVALASLWF